MIQRKKLKTEVLTKSLKKKKKKSFPQEVAVNSSLSLLTTIIQSGSSHLLSFHVAEDAELSDFWRTLISLSAEGLSLCNRVRLRLLVPPHTWRNVFLHILGIHTRAAFIFSWNAFSWACNLSFSS